MKWLKYKRRSEMEGRVMKYIVQENVHSLNPDHDTNQQQDLQYIEHDESIENIPTGLELKSKAKNGPTNFAKRKKKIKANIHIQNAKQLKIAEVSWQVKVDSEEDPYLNVCKDKPDPYENITPEGNGADLLISVNHDSIENDVELMRNNFKSK